MLPLCLSSEFRSKPICGQGDKWWVILGFESFLAPRNVGSFGWFFQGDGWVRRRSSENSKKANHSFTCQYILVFESLNILYKVNFKTCPKLLGLKIYQEML